MELSCSYDYKIRDRFIIKECYPKRTNVKRSKRSPKRETVFEKAKKLKKEFPHEYDNAKNPWQKYVAWASKIYSEQHGGKSPVGKPHKKKSMPKRRTPPKTKSKRKAHKIGDIKMPAKKHTDYNRNKVDISIGAVRHYTSLARKGLEQELEKQMLQQWKATKKTDKKKIGKKIADLKSRIVKLS